MVGGRLCSLSCLFMSSAVLLFGVSLADVEASSCPRVIHRKVGDTVEISPCLPANKLHQLTNARWKLRGNTIVDRKTPPNRYYLNNTTYSITVKMLTLQDSGEYQFVSDMNGSQPPTISITLNVHEPIAQQPVLWANSTWDNVNASCSVLLDCSSAYGMNVNYSLSVKNQTYNRSRLQLPIPEGTETTVTCTISDLVSETSTSETVKCSNNSVPTATGESKLIYVLAGAVGCALIVIIIVTAMGVCCCRQKSAVTSDMVPDQTVYAEVTDVVPQNGTATTKSCSLYETIDNRKSPVTPVSPGPQTVYDEIQLHRVRMHYQES